MKKIILVAFVSVALITGCSKSKTDVAGMDTPAVIADKTVTAGFTVGGATGELKEKTSVQFTNTSQNAVSYVWDFGNGRTYIDKEPVYENPACGYYHVTLTATDAKGNSAVTSKDVEISCIFANMPHPPKF